MGGGIMSELTDERQVIAAAAAFAAGDVTYHEHFPAELPPIPDAEPMVSRGVRLPASLDKRIRDAATTAGVPFSQLIREWIELGLTEMDTDRTVPLSALRRAIAHAAQSGHPA
jgi:predicted DNA-binding protein